MSYRKSGARRRTLTFVSALVAAVALAALSSGAGATSKCEVVLGTATFTDATADGTPDISQVVVTTYEDGNTQFQISLPGTSEFTADMLARTYIDADRDTATGSDKGFEYMIQSVPAGTLGAVGPFSTKCYQPSSALYAWNGTGWVKQDTETLDSWYGDESLTVRINASEFGKAMVFNLAVYAAAGVTYDESGVPNVSSASSDWAPDSGTYAYKPFEWASYTDAVNDGSAEGAPDITGAEVLRKGGQLKFTVSIPGTYEFNDDMLLRVFIDSDGSAATGDGNGYDYLLQGQRVPFGKSSLMSTKSVLHALCTQPTVTLFKWGEGSWSAVETDSLDWWFEYGATITLDSAAIGSPATFNFAAYAASKVTFDESGWPNLTTEPAFDRAPDTGSLAFPLVVSTAELVGDYKVTSKVIKSKGNLEPKKTSKKVWSFQKSCSKKTCSTKVNMKGQGKVKLSRAGKTSYKARAGGKKISCSSSVAARTTQSFSMKVKKGALVKGKWRVTKWVGTLKVSAKKKACGSYTAALTGTLKK